MPFMLLYFSHRDKRAGRGEKNMNQFIKETDTVHAGVNATEAEQVDGEATPPTVKTGADLLCSLLLESGVDVIFGYPGGAVLPIYDSLYDSSIRHILTKHEQGAVHAAEGYARVTGKTGVVLVTSGPGATNLVTGIADAYMDSTPLVVLTGQVTMESIGRDAFQEADIMGITMPVTKHNYQIRDVNDLPQVIADAFHIANSGRPGPVLIDLPKNITAGAATY